MRSSTTSRTRRKAAYLGSAAEGRGSHARRETQRAVRSTTRLPAVGVFGLQTSLLWVELAETERSVLIETLLDSDINSDIIDV